ncbi:BQ2448_6291 [Microbotryum intermedium]|uniref:BQ2448_6291 protein n=1 Tax=Microbotryum intermedium TaxID=269621 RepID=A0A238FNV3_9BASI|nr:BQ2448_6291 [Microbotryum intermedium]
MCVLAILYQSPQQRRSKKSLGRLLSLLHVSALNPPSVKTVNGFVNNLAMEIPLFMPRPHKLPNASQLVCYPLYSTHPQKHSAAQTWRWRVDLPAEVRSPMARSRARDFFCQEIAWLPNQRFVFIDSFAIFDEPLLDLYSHNSHRNRWTFLLLKDLGKPFLGVKANGSGMRAKDSFLLKPLPLRNPLRQIDSGKEVVVMPQRLFLDDFSGGVSKRMYHVVHVCSTQNLGLPTEFLHSRAFVNHLCVRAWGEALDLATPVLQDLAFTIGQPIPALDSRTKSDALLQVPLLYSVHDTPMAAEITGRSVTSGSVHYACRFCHYGGTAEQQLQHTSIIAFFECPDGLSAKRTKEECLAQLTLFRDTCVATDVNDLQTQTGTRAKATVAIISELKQIYRDHMSHMSTERWRKGGPPPEVSDQVLEYRAAEAAEKTRTRETNAQSALATVAKRFDELGAADHSPGPFLEVPCYDPHLDAPPDLLHVMYLGVVKYLWGQTLDNLSTRAIEYVAAVFRSMSTHGFEGNFKFEFYFDYKWRLTGKDYRMLVQVFPLISEMLLARGLTAPEVNECWGLLGKLAHLTSWPVAPDLDGYVGRYRSLARTFVQASMRSNLGHVLRHIKYHHLIELDHSILRLGTPTTFEASVAESANKVVRELNMNTNHHDPSRDVSIQLADDARIGFVVSGGEWRTASGKILHGRRIWLQRTRSNLWASATGSVDPKILDYAHNNPQVTNSKDLRSIRAVKLPNGDRCLIGTWCFVRQSNGLRCQIAFVRAMAAPRTRGEHSHGYVAVSFAHVMEEFGQSGFIHMELSAEIVILSTECIQSLAVVQHDCIRAQCAISSIFNETDGRRHTGRTLQALQHVDSSLFLLSTISQRSHKLFHVFAPPLPTPDPLDVFATEIESSKAAEVLRSKIPKSKKVGHAVGSFYGHIQSDKLLQQHNRILAP